MMQQMIDDCVRMARHMEIHDYLRVDWRLDVEGQPRMLDVNPNSSWCWNTFMAEMAEWDGIFYADLLDLILQAALKRYKLLPANGS
jgi:D-alanine-D-alanine ligase